MYTDKKENKRKQACIARKLHFSLTTSIFQGKLCGSNGNKVTFWNLK